MGKKVLIIEDSPGIRLSLEVAFKAAGLEVVTAQDGTTGLDLALSAKPDLVILDLFLPEMDGMKVLEWLKNERGTEKIPVVIFSALSQPSDKDAAMQLGAADYIVKSEVSVRDAVGRALRHLSA